LRKRAKMKRESERRDVFQKYIGEIAKACGEISSGVDAEKLYEALLTQAKKRTAIADAHLDDAGKVIKEAEELETDGVLVVESAASVIGATPTAAEKAGGRSSEMPPMTQSRAEAAALKVAAMQNDDQEQGRSKKGASKPPSVPKSKTPEK